MDGADAGVTVPREDVIWRAIQPRPIASAIIAARLAGAIHLLNGSTLLDTSSALSPRVPPPCGAAFFCLALATSASNASRDPSAAGATDARSDSASRSVASSSATCALQVAHSRRCVVIQATSCGSVT
jgi:hypothetical protein